MNYHVKKEFEQNAVGDVIRLNPRQAKYLLLSEHIAAVAVGVDLAAQETDIPVKGDKK